MFEACIDKRTGEIIVVKPTGAPWSDKERDGPVLVVVELDDPDLKLRGAVKAYPYEVFGVDYDDPEQPEIRLTASRWKIDRRQLAPGASFRRVDLKENLADYPPREHIERR